MPPIAPKGLPWRMLCVATTSAGPETTEGDGPGDHIDPSFDGVSAVAPDVAEIPDDVRTAGTDESTETMASRLDRWKRRLLDLSLRNRLLNFKDTRKTLPLLCTDLSKLEDMLADGRADPPKSR